MPVAVRLVEVLTLITLLGILTGVSIIIVVAQRFVCLSLLLLGPLVTAVSTLLHAMEKVLVGSLLGVLRLTNSVGSAAR